jgi:AraC-like DNA-binding protein
MRMEAGDIPGLIWQIIGWALVCSALSDGLIVMAQIFGAAYLQPWIISISASTTLIIIGALTLSGALENSAGEPEDLPAPPREADALDAQIMAQLEAMMVQSKPYLNPDLTMSQLSRRLRIPVRQLSGAINRVAGENASRYINAARIAAAQSALLEGETVTQAMLGAGFNTKSNFNREFLRVTGDSPSDWMAKRKVP